MNSTDKNDKRLDLAVRLGSCLIPIVMGVGLVIVIVHAVQYVISFIQNPSETWGATWSNITKGLISHLKMLIQILIHLLVCGLFFLIVIRFEKLYFRLLHGRKINKRLFAQEDFRNTNLRKLTDEMRELADDICQNDDPHVNYRVYLITIRIRSLNGRHSVISRIIWNFTDLVSQIIMIIRLIVCGVYKIPKEKLSADLLRTERILDDFILQKSCSEYYKEHISKKIRALADKIDNNQTKIFNKAKREIELSVQNKVESATDSKSYKDLSKYQKCMFWVVLILVCSIFFLLINWLYFYIAHFLRWLGLSVPETCWIFDIS